MKVTRHETFEDYVCDVCGKPATGDFWFEVHCNDDIVFETKHVVDLCPECAQKYKTLFMESLSKYFPERYKTVTEEDKKEIIEAIKNQEMPDWYYL